ncbi:MAG: hypothetical protein SGPRY_006409 [Prymnesium sp.]
MRGRLAHSILLSSIGPFAALALLLAIPQVSAYGKSPGERQLAILTRTPEEQHSTNQQQTSYAVFAAGCFWGVELAFARLPGVLHTDVGYTGGSTESPSYRDVTTGRTGHAEAVRVGYDPSRIRYSDLLDVFFDCHDPTTSNRQGNDVGTQYRSAIFYGDEEERQMAVAAISAEQKRIVQLALPVSSSHGILILFTWCVLHRVQGKQVVTQLESLGPFYAAETYHQQYLVKGGQSGSKGDTTPIRCYG